MCGVAATLHAVPDHSSPSRPQISRSHALTPPPHPLEEDARSIAFATASHSAMDVHPAAAERRSSADRFHIPRASITADDDSAVQYARLGRHAEPSEDAGRPRTAPAFACVPAAEKPAAREMDALVGFEISRQRQLYEVDMRQKQVRAGRVHNHARMVVYSSAVAAWHKRPSAVQYNASANAKRRQFVSHCIARTSVAQDAESAARRETGLIAMRRLLQPDVPNSAAQAMPLQQLSTCVPASAPRLHRKLAHALALLTACSAAGHGCACDDEAGGGDAVSPLPGSPGSARYTVSSAALVPDIAHGVAHEGSRRGVAVPLSSD